MLYTIMQRYLWQQLQHIQTLQYQQSQYMAWQYQQLQSWQYAMLSSVFFDQLRWLPHDGVWTAQFGPFSWPLLQYRLHIASQPAQTPLAAAVNEPIRPIRDVVAAPTTPTAKTIATKPAQVEQTTDAKADISTLVVPAELLTSPPQQTETAPPQADIPQPKTSDSAHHLEKPASQSVDKSQQNKQQPLLPADTPLSKSSLNEAEKVLRQLQRDDAGLPAPAQLVNIDTAMMTLDHPHHLPTIEPVSALEQAKQSVDVIDLNQATEAQLLRLAGINRRMAKAIIDYRNHHTAFTQVDELTNIKGIGQATLNKIRHCLIINETAQRTTKTVATDQQQPMHYPTDNPMPLKPNKLNK